MKIEVLYRLMISVCEYGMRVQYSRDLSQISIYIDWNNYTIYDTFQDVLVVSHFHLYEYELVVHCWLEAKDMVSTLSWNRDSKTVPSSGGRDFLEKKSLGTPKGVIVDLETEFSCPTRC